MVFSLTHARLTRTSSDLRMLSAILLPPSPILSANDLPLSSTSGEIPILLETTGVYHSPLPTFSDLPGLHDVTKEHKRTDKLDTVNGEALPKSSTCEELGNTYMALEFPNAHCAGGDLSSNPCPAIAVSSGLNDVVCTAHDHVLGSDAGHTSIPGHCSMPTPVKQGKFEGARDLQASCPSTTKLSITTMASREDSDLDGHRPLTIATFHTYSTLPTPIFAPPSPSSSADVISPSSSPVVRQHHRRPLERTRAVRFPGRPRSPRLQVNEVESNLMRDAPHSPVRRASCPRWQLTDPVSPVSAYSCMVDTRASDAAYPFMKHVALPEEFSWIKYMTIELWIDQEGFRAIRSCLQLVGYSPRTRSLHPYESAEKTESGITAGVAEFMPMKRETFAFHYATLDNSPTLRMVSVADDESHDYISRQATLSVKSNGVYTVLGTETFIASILNSGVHKPRLGWKFDYLVSDRRADGTGKTLSREKTLTPLTFSCSPYLLHPLQGKRASPMHIMKKSLIPKLGSQKLEPPTYTSDHSILPEASRRLSTGRDTSTHARSLSDISVKSGRCSLTKSRLDTGVRKGTILSTGQIPRAGRRRASSAGENSLTCSMNEPRHASGRITTTKRRTFVPGTTIFQ